LLARSQRGITKYGTTTDRTDLTLPQWLQHAYEEALDMAVYLKRAMRELDRPPLYRVTPSALECDYCRGRAVVGDICPKCRGGAEILK
jgi:hypothetical protein